MKNNQTNKIGLIHLGKKEKSGFQISEKLQQYNFSLTEWTVSSEDEKLNGLHKVDIIVVNIGKAKFDYELLLQGLFDNDKKIVINEASVTNKLSGVRRLSWERHLLNKIDPDFKVMPDYTKTLENRNVKVNLESFGIKQVWILAASIGGPEAIQNFLNSFTGNEAFLFIVLQHIDKEFQESMATQIGQNCKFNIRVPLSGETIKAGKCLIHPIDEHLEFSHSGVIELMPISKESKYTPCIDDCSKKLSKNLLNLNMAIFSGMSSDGIIAAKYIKKNGGKVITQTEQSCVLSSIITGVKKVTDINYEGTPEELAEYIINQ